MKLEIEVYDLTEELFFIHDNKVTKFRPKSLRIVSKYNGYTGENWGDQPAGRGTGYPITIHYGNGENSELLINHDNLFKTKEELLKSL